jgi:RNA polymerase sigma-70 factor, ECF subfamily
MPVSRQIEQDDGATVEALRAGDEAAFLALVRRHHPSMVRVARLFVGREAAEDVAQEAWLAVLRGVGSFEGRSSLRSWIMSIVANKARTRFGRDLRTVPLSSLSAEEGTGEAAVEAERFRAPGDPEWPGHWATPPVAWPEAQLLQGETMAEVARAIELLPEAPRAVITLRDVEGWDAAETCALLGLSEANQRVLLHRARSRVRRAVEQHLAAGGVQG